MQMAVLQLPCVFLLPAVCILSFVVLLGLKFDGTAITYAEVRASCMSGLCAPSLNALVILYVCACCASRDGSYCCVSCGK